MAGFLYRNSSIRVGEQNYEPKNRSIQWYDHSTDLWDKIKWQQAISTIQSHCRGNDADAKVIEDAYNKLDYYVGNKSVKAFRDDGLIGKEISEDAKKALLRSLISMKLGSSGTALSLLSYVFKKGDKLLTDENAGFSFENRTSELFQRIFNPNTSIKNIKKFRSGGQQAFVGDARIYHVGSYTTQKERNKLLREIPAEVKQEISNKIQYVYEDIAKGIDENNTEKDLFISAYKVPMKADITVPSGMTCKFSYGGTLGRFVEILQSGVRLSLKNTSQNLVTLGETKDATRLRGFISEYVEGIQRDFATVSTFIFSSKQNNTPKRELDWARVLYELIGTGQHRTFGDDGLLVDYLVVNRYKNNIKGSGHVSVYSINTLLELLKESIPTANVTPPFIVQPSSGQDNKEGEGPVKLNLNQIQNFYFSH